MPKEFGTRPKVSRHELRDLDIEIGFLEGLLRRDQKNVDVLQVLGDDYTRRGRFDEGLKIDEALAKLCPKDPTVYYNLACSYALTKRCEQSATTLIRAIELGYNDFKWLMRDPDLEDLHQHPVFEKVRAKIKRVKINVK
jgi:tetratricopeptide (TPR) repeat protein